MQRKRKGGMAVSAVWTLAYLLATLPSETKEHAKTHTGETHCATLLKSKSKRLLV